MQFLYFDPGLGAMIVQAIVAAVAGVFMFSKNLVYKLKVFFGITKKSDFYDDIEVSDTADVENESKSDK
ncbi:MAG: hypothetical protein P8K68_06130 [Algibacter sp.]|uniref:hypothetical protein n=1 Tax=Algibacter sp. TaxID=1872428 RepID=UPI00262D0B29|nr:hypothetical protein [Algibacter sp.]MDG1730027.1 hypothetical protein [Algibacter sp.]MDG2178350.1 hypothetical protein [Algibacter sp.]